MTTAERIAEHPAVAAMAIQELEAANACLREFIATLFPQPIPPEQIRAALTPETENQYEAI